jgi:hypothetical protein
VPPQPPGGFVSYQTGLVGVSGGGGEGHVQCQHQGTASEECGVKGLCPAHPVWCKCWWLCPCASPRGWGEAGGFMQGPQMAVLVLLY